MSWEYWVLLLATIGLGLLLCEYRPNKIKKAIYLFVVFAVMTLIAGFRYGIGYDYFAYQNIFAQTTDWNSVLNGTIEPGFLAIFKLIKFITADAQIMYLVLAVLINLAFVIFVYFYVDDRGAWISCLAFIAFGFFFGTMNLVRQYFAAIICLYAMHYMKKRKILPFLIIVIIAALIHKTALILIPIYFIANLKPNWKLYTGYGVATIVFYAFSNQIIKFIINTFNIFEFYDPDTSYYMTKGLSYVYLFIPAICFALLLLFSKKLLEKDRNNAVYINLAYFNLLIYFISTKHFILQRFSELIYISVIISLPILFDLLRVKKEDVEFVTEQKKISKKGLNPTQAKKIQAEYVDAKKQIKDKKNFYIFGLTAVILVMVLNNLFVAGMKYHKVFPYYSINDKETVDKMIEEGW